MSPLPSVDDGTGVSDDACPHCDARGAWQDDETGCCKVCHADPYDMREGRPPFTRADCGRQHVAAALVAIEDAQNTLYRAAEALCAVIGFNPEWTAVATHATRTKALWHRVNAKLEKARARGRDVLIDGEPSHYDAKWFPVEEHDRLPPAPPAPLFKCGDCGAPVSVELMKDHAAMHHREKLRERDREWGPVAFKQQPPDGEQP